MVSTRVFPWLGDHPAQGYQIGVISVPLIDDLQNHLVRGTILFNLNSSWPDINLTYTNTRYRLPIQLKMFKNLVYNGWMPRPTDNKDITHYLDEFGAQVQVKHSMAINHLTTLSYVLGWKTSHITPNQPPYLTPYGVKNEPYVSGTIAIKPLKDLVLATRGTVIAPLSWYNTHFNYHKVRARMSITYDLMLFERQTTIEASASYGHTRGEPDKTFYLKELYTPIITAISNAVSTDQRLNRVREHLLGERAFLYRSIFGDTYFRNVAAISTPILTEMDKQLSIFYLNKLDLNLFVNWGQTWWATTWPQRQAQPFDLKQSILAYAGSVDLHLENKGVNCFIGLGLGNLVGEGLALYSQAGFTALF